MKIAGAVAIVTGGARGFGKGFTEALLKRGAKVCFADLNETEGQATEDTFKQQYGQDSVNFVKCDISKEADIKDVFDVAIQKYSGIDIMVNNAGISNERQWETMVDVNLVGTMHGSNIAIERMRKDKGGRGGLIVNIASMAGLGPAFFMPAYAATKHAIVGFTRSWASNPLSKATYGLSFAVVCPAFGDTRMLNDGLYAKEPPFVTFEENRDLINMMMTKSGILSVDDVVKAFVDLVEKENNNGAVVTIHKTQGTKYLFTEGPK